MKKKDSYQQHAQKISKVPWRSWRSRLLGSILAATNTKLTFYSNRAISQNDLGRRELRQENPEKAKYHLRRAIADCTEAIRLNPKYTAAYNNRGLAKYRLGQAEADCSNSQEAECHYHAAIADLDKAIQLNPKHVKAHRNRGYVKEKLGQQAAAEADFEKAKALDSAAQTE